MAVNVQSKGCSIIPHIVLDCFYVIAVLKKQNCIGMAEIMDSRYGHSNRSSQLLEMVVNRLRMEMAAYLVGKTKYSCWSFLFV